MRDLGHALGIETLTELRQASAAGRLQGARDRPDPQPPPQNALDLERVFEVALETGVALEVNGLPAPLDLAGGHVRDAFTAGVKIVCSTDAHSTRGLPNMGLSVTTARRGGAQSGDVLNTRSLRELGA